MTEIAVTQDTLLDRKVKLLQPQNGYRVAIDPVFLASAVQAQAGEHVLDVGAGVGAASLCLAYRVPGCRVTGLEVQRPYIRLAQQNSESNGMRARVEFLYGDLRQSPPRLAAGTFAHVMANPPYLEAVRSRPATTVAKDTANREGETPLELWARFCLLMVKPKGTVTFIHRADRLQHLLTTFSGKLGNIEIFPLWSGPGKPANRIVLRGRKSLHGALVLHSGLVLHNENGGYTTAAEEILREGKALQF